MTEMTAEKVRALLEAATIGPWLVIDSDQGHPAGPEWEVYAPRREDEDHTGWVGQQSDLAGEDGGICWTAVGGRRDAEFIAAAPEIAAWGLAEHERAERLAAQVAAVEALARRCNEGYSAPYGHAIRTALDGAR